MVGNLILLFCPKIQILNVLNRINISLNVQSILGVI